MKTDEQPMITMPLKVGIAAFALAAVGVVLGFTGWYAVNSPPLARFGFFMTVAGVLIGFVAILVGQILYGRRAIVDGVKAAKDLTQKLK